MMGEWEFLKGEVTLMPSAIVAKVRIESASEGGGGERGEMGKGGRTRTKRVNRKRLNKSKNCWRNQSRSDEGGGRVKKKRKAGSFLCFQKFLVGFYGDPATSTAGRSGNSGPAAF